jgi:hypothetical protein
LLSIGAGFVAASRRTRARKPIQQYLELVDIALLAQLPGERGYPMFSLPNCILDYCAAGLLALCPGLELGARGQHRNPFADSQQHEAAH